MKNKYSLLIRTVTRSIDECSGSLSCSGQSFQLKHFDEYKDLLEYMNQETYDDYSHQTYYTDLQQENLIQ